MTHTNRCVQAFGGQGKRSRLESVAMQFSGCDIIVFVDNESALASMIRVVSSNNFMGAVCSIIIVVADLELEKDDKIWFERVPSNSNPAGPFER